MLIYSAAHFYVCRNPIISIKTQFIDIPNIVVISSLQKIIYIEFSYQL
jgi:hypothetical protein